MVLLQTTDGQGVNDLILKSLPEGGEKKFQSLSASISISLAPIFFNNGRSQVLQL